jgi:hypothetical protein
LELQQASSGNESTPTAEGSESSEHKILMEFLWEQLGGFLSEKESRAVNATDFSFRLSKIGAVEVFFSKKTGTEFHAFLFS